jgi:hypothetical protein
MRVLLVEPPKTPWEMMGDVVAPPLGLAQLAGCLEEAKIPVEILDANALELGLTGLEEAIAQANPDLIGMTVFTPYVPDVARALRVARRAAPEAAIVLGGPHATFTVEETLETMPEVDIIVRGEGDQIIIDLARALDAGDGLEEVPGISYRRDGSIVENPAPPRPHAATVACLSPDAHGPLPLCIAGRPLCHRRSQSRLSLPVQFLLRVAVLARRLAPVRPGGRRRTSRHPGEPVRAQEYLVRRRLL